MNPVGVVTALPMLFTRQVPTVDRLRPHRTRHTPTRAARAILVALGTITLADLAGTSTGTMALAVVTLALLAFRLAEWIESRRPFAAVRSSP